MHLYGKHTFHVVVYFSTSFKKKLRFIQYLAEIQLFENLNIEKIIFKVVQMKFLAMHITNQKLSFDIFMVGNVQKYLHAT